jgi:tetratricopeptide (TPR) repeat protein
MHADQPQEDLERAIAAGYKDCAALFQAHEWPEAEHASSEMLVRWASTPDLSFRSRVRLAQAMVIRWTALGQLDQAVSARESLTGLIVWLRSQPETEFHALQTRMLCHQMARDGFMDEALDSLEELVQLVDELDDLALTKDVAERVVAQMSRLLYISDENQARYSQAYDALDLGEDDPPEPEDIGISGPLIARLDRVADALSDLADCLDIEDDDAATELRASLLLSELQAVTRLGQAEKAEALFETFASLGHAALAACDALVSLNEQAAEQGHPWAPEAVPAVLILKAGTLIMNDKDETALALLTEIVERFEGSSSMAAMVRQARDMQSALLDEEDAAT